MTVFSSTPIGLFDEALHVLTNVTLTNFTHSSTKICNQFTCFPWCMHFFLAFMIVVFLLLNFCTHSLWFFGSSVLFAQQFMGPWNALSASVKLTGYVKHVWDFDISFCYLQAN